MPLIWKYSYTMNRAGSGNQYLDAGIDLKGHSCVDAVYTRSVIPADRGNPLLEALPDLPDPDDFPEVFRRSIDGYHPLPAEEMNQRDRLLCVSQLSDVRIELPFHRILAIRMNEALRNAYKNRQIRSVLIVPGKSEGPGKQEAEYQGESPVAAAAVTGFSLLGYSGCGKSSALEIVTDRYPQVIIHRPESGGRITQIVYLTVTCLPNSNFSGLYSAVGEAVDKALNVQDRFHQKYIEKARRLNDKLSRVKELVEKYFIGMIIFDEIQLIDFSENRENTYSSLLNLSNTTGVALGVVGTEEAYSKLFSKLYTGRRAGSVITADTYCGSEPFCGLIIRNLFEYQWTEDELLITEEICGTIYRLTKGIISQIVVLCKNLQIDYITRKRKPEFNSQYVEHVFKKNSAGIEDLLNGLPEIHWNPSETYEPKQKQISVKAKFKEEPKTQETLQRNIIENVQTFTEGNTESQIKKAIRKAIRDIPLTEENFQKVQKKVLEVLKAEKKKESAELPKEKIETNCLKEYIQNSILDVKGS